MVYFNNFIFCNSCISRYKILIIFMATSNQGISIIISVFGQNSEVNLLLKQLINSNTKYKGDYEIIVIGDGYEVKLDDDLKSENKIFL